MDSDSSSNKWLRWAFAGLFLFLAITLMQNGGVMVLFSILLFGFFGICVLPELIRPFTLVIDWLFGTLPGSGGKPPLDLRLARFYVKKERYEHALEEYRRIMKLYPGILEPYQAILDILAILGASPEEMEAIYQRGQRNLKEEADREELRDAYEEAKLKAIALSELSATDP